MNIKNNKGMVMLIVSYVIVAVLLILGVVFFSRSFSEMKITQRQKSSIQALSIAEAGIERASYYLKQDYDQDSTPSWTDGLIYFGEDFLSWGPHYNDFEEFIASTDYGKGSYIVELKNVPGRPDEIWVKSAGRIGDTEKIIQTYMKVRNFNIWNNAIFAGSGASGAMINGNVDIRGSVHILGEGLEPFDYAMDMSGSALIGNNYDGMSAALLSKIPACPTRLYNGETVETLDAEVRVKNGLVGLSGSGTLGDPDNFGNPYKETMDGVFVTDGYGGNKGAGNVNSDNGTEHVYDLGDAVQLPSLSDPYETYPTYMDYLKDNALVISDSAQLNQLANIQPNSNFSYVDPGGNGSITMDGSGNLAINGVVYIDNGGDLEMKWTGPSRTINYTGRGSVVVTGDVELKINLYADSNFPESNVLGIMTPNTITFDSSNKEVMGAFFAEDEIICSKQTEVTGTFVSNYFNMGNQVPSIYQVPELADNLPPGMINPQAIWIMLTVAWQEL